MRADSRKRFVAAVFASRDAQARAASSRLAALIRAAAAKEGRAAVALAGGSTPRECYGHLAQEELPWRNVEFFPTDERRVPAGSARRNDGMIRGLLGSPARVRALRAGGPAPALHAALLGMGEDGHIASLFPDMTDYLDADDDKIRVVEPRGIPESRLTLPMSSFAYAPALLLLICGKKKWQLLSAPPPPIAALLALCRRPPEVFFAE